MPSVTPSLPERLRVELGPRQFSEPVVGPDDPYIQDCWTAVLGPTPVLCYLRLHQLIGSEIATVALAGSLGIGGRDRLARLGRCLGRLGDYGALALAEARVWVTPALRLLTNPEVHDAGPIVLDLHLAYLALHSVHDGVVSISSRPRARNAPARVRRA